MAKNKPRVLVDLSLAARGYCGIAQDVRLLYKALASCPDLDVTGLIYVPRALRPLHKFLPQGAHRGDRIANQAAFLWQLAAGNSDWQPLKSWRTLHHLRQFASTVLASRVQLDPLDVEVFWDVVWRLLFSPTLAADDIPLVQGGKFLLSNLSNGMIQSRVLLRRRSLKLDTRDYDFLIVQDARPLRLSPRTWQIVRHHDLIPLVRPDTMRNPWYIKWQHRSIRQHFDRKVYVCNSQPTRDELTTAYPELGERSTTIPDMLGDTYYHDERPEMVERIIGRRRSLAAGAPAGRIVGGCPRYVLGVSTLEPRKNFVGLIEAFNILKGRSAADKALKDLKLVIVGSPGWKYEPILDAMRDLVERGELVHLEKVPAEEMRVLYTSAAAFVFPSNSEGFGFPPLEAMQCGTPVVASDISTHRWVLGDAALYCNPYDVTSIARAIESLVGDQASAGLREKLVARGRERVKLYHAQRCGRQWLDLLHGLQANRGLVDHAATLTLPELGSLGKVA